MGRKPGNEEVILESVTDGDGRQVYRSSFTVSGQGGTKALLASRLAVIPVIFLPGLMGTNLRSRESGEAVWRPPNASFRPTDILGIIGALLTWGFRGPKERQEALDAAKLEVDDRGSIALGQSGLSRETARARGWGSVSRTSYNPVMALLQERLNAMMRRGEPGAWWEAEGMRDPADYGEELGGNAPLTRDELSGAARYRFDVWCCGYNWLQSNRDSARDLLAYIDGVVLEHYRGEEELEPQAGRMKVILVTHSMGGLVARALKLVEGGEERILGVIHGVQPATGAPAIYHHMRCGYEGLERFVLGRNAGQVTAVAARSAGCLELVPTFDHRDGAPWLFACREGEWDPADTEGLPLRLPQQGDPYREIYQSQEWYGLVPKQNEKFLDLSGKTRGPASSARTDYDLKIDSVARFHDEVAGQYVAATYVHYGAFAGLDMHSWRDVVWQGDLDWIASSGSATHDNGRGTYGACGRAEGVSLTRVAGAGDGTVCVWSGSAPAKTGKRQGVEASFQHGDRGSGCPDGQCKEYGHQGSFNDKGGRTQWASLYSIVKIAQRADWSPEEV